MLLKQLVKHIPFILCCGIFIYGFILFAEASQPCGSDGCLLHLLYLVAVPMMIAGGIAAYRLGKKLFKKEVENK